MYIELKNINKSFGDFKASDNVSFGIEKGKLIGLLGPSGSGKTTILRMLAGLEKQDSGDIIIDGKNVNKLPSNERGIGFVFQSYALFPFMTVYDNIAYGLKVQKKDKKFIRQRVAELLELVGLPDVGKRYPDQLSGGQRQRIALARALAPQPELLLLDEPFAAIDAKVRKELRTWLRDTIDKIGITSIFVTHDQDEAIEVADEIVITNKGRVEQIGNPVEIYLEPKTPFVAQFIGQSAVIEDYSKLKGFNVIQMDADGQHDVCNIPKIYQRLKEKDDDGRTPDIVLGSRFMKGSTEFEVSFAKKMAFVLFRKMLYLATGRKIADPTTGLQGLSRKAVLYYSKYNHFDDKYPDTNMITQMLLLDFKVVEIPAVMHARTSGKSMHSGLKPIWYMMRMFYSVLAVIFRCKVLKMDAGAGRIDVEREDKKYPELAEGKRS